MSRGAVREELERAKRWEAESGDFCQPLPKPYLDSVLAEILPREKVVLIGGGEETTAFRRKAETVCVDICGTPYSDIIHDAERLTEVVPAGSADHVAMFNMMEITYNPVGVVSEAYRALKPGGRLWLGDVLGANMRGEAVYYCLRPDGRFTHRELEDELLERGLMRKDAYGEIFSFCAETARDLLVRAGFPEGGVKERASAEAEFDGRRIRTALFVADK